MQTQIQTTLSAKTANVGSNQRTRFEIDSAHASAQFKVRHLMVSNVRGELGAISGEALIDEADLSRSEVTAKIDVTAIDTKNPDRDAHLRGPDFFDVERYPSITFRSHSVRALADNQLQISGELTIRGVTRNETLNAELSEPVTDPWGNVKRGVTATARLNRKDFGVSWNAAMDAGGVVVGDNVDVTIELELVKR